MKKEDENTTRKKARYKRNPGGKRTSRSFAAGGTYLLIPLLGLVLAFSLFYFAKDFFLGDEKIEYKKPDFAVERESTAAGEREVSPAANENSKINDKAERDGEEAESPSAEMVQPDIPEEASLTEIDTYQEDPSWGVQVAMLRSQEDASRLAERIEEQGFNVDITKPGDLYRVRIRGGTTRTSALKVEKLLSAAGYDTLVVQSDGAAPIDETSQEKKVSSKKKDPRYMEDNTWGVQVGMLAYEEDAERLAEDLRKKGFNVDITKPGKYFRVRVRGGSSRDSAVSVEKLLKDEGLETLVVRSAE
jgi:cell division protein FtsN